MLAIRLQRTGRHGHAQFRLIVQDSRFSPKGGRIVAYLGNYDPHTKVATIDSDKAASYLANGAQPSDRAAKLLKKEGLKLPAWVKISEPKKRQTRHGDKLRRNRPPEEKVKEPAPEAEPAAETEAPPKAEPETETTDEATPEAEPAVEESPQVEAEPAVDGPAKETAEAAEEKPAEPEKTS
jgi:small subunit ribosomal protein S16